MAILTFIAPNGAGQVLNTRGLTYTANSYGVISVNTAAAGYEYDVQDLMNAGCITTGVSGSSSGGYIEPKNALEGGDFGTNPMQRNIAGLATAGVFGANSTSNTPQYFADRWFAFSGNNAGNNTSVQQSLVTVTGAALGITKGISIQRANNNTANIVFGQALASASSIRLQGYPVTFSFYGSAGANFSGANGAFNYWIYSGTGTNQNATLLATGGWTGQAVVASGTGTLASSTSRFSCTGLVPVTATQLGVLVGYTPTGNATAVVDSFVVSGLQLEAGAAATTFDRRPAGWEADLCQRYCYVVPEPAANTVVAVGGTLTNAANQQQYLLPIPTQIPLSITTTVGAGSWKVTAGAASANASSLTAGNNTPNSITLTTTNTQTAGGAAALLGGGGTGYIIISGDL